MCTSAVAHILKHCRKRKAHHDGRASTLKLHLRDLLAQQMRPKAVHSLWHARHLPVFKYQPVILGAIC
jgi:hypothetical protein